MKIKTIAIIGLGLMGGSLAARCRKKFPHAKIIGISRSTSSLRFALRKKWIHQGFENLEKGISDADLIVICTPVDTFVKTMILIDHSAKKGAVVTDVGSVKGLMSMWMKKSRLQKVHFVGAHPMVGSHTRGIEASRFDLYDKGLVFVTPDKSAHSKSIALVKSFWKKIARKVVVLEAAKHDQMVAEISHLPHLIAACLVESTSAQARGFAGAGFKDTTRIAEGHPSVWLPIFMANQGQVLGAIKTLEKTLQKFKSGLIKNDHQALFSMLQNASLKRSQI